MSDVYLIALSAGSTTTDSTTTSTDANKTDGTTTTTTPTDTTTTQAEETSKDEVEVLVENKTLTAKSEANITDWAANGSYATDFTIVDWSDGKTYSYSDYSSITVEYEKPEGWKGGYLIINSGDQQGDNGTGWKKASEWNYTGKLSIDIPEGKEFCWVCVRMYAETAETDVNLTIKKLYLTKK